MFRCLPFAMPQNATETAMTAQNMQNSAFGTNNTAARINPYDSRLLALREQIAPRFEVLTFKDPKQAKKCSTTCTPRKI